MNSGKAPGPDELNHWQATGNIIRNKWTILKNLNMMCWKCEKYANRYNDLSDFVQIVMVRWLRMMTKCEYLQNARFYGVCTVVSTYCTKSGPLKDKQRTRNRVMGTQSSFMSKGSPARSFPIEELLEHKLLKTLMQAVMDKCHTVHLSSITWCYDMTGGSRDDHWAQKHFSLHKVRILNERFLTLDHFVLKTM